VGTHYVAVPMTGSGTDPPLLSHVAARATRRAMLLAVCVPGTFLIVPLLLGNVWGEVDTQRLELALQCAFREQERLGHGRWLLSLIGNGSPALGWPSSALYPLRWFQLTLPPDLGASLHPVFHLTAGAAATAWLARTFHLRLYGAACAGVLFVLSGTVLDLVAKPYYATGALYIPLVWAATRCALSQRGRPIHVVTIAVGVAFELLGGEAHTFGMLFAIVALECTRALLRRRSLARTGAVALAVIAGLSVGWLQWGQTLAEAQLTARAGGIDTTFVWAFESLGWLSTLWPGAATEWVAPGRMLGQMFTNEPDRPLDWNIRAYVGLVFLAALLTGALRPRLRTPALVFFLFLLASLGEQTPFLPLLHKVLPLLDRFRYPAKYLVPAMLGAAIIVAAQLERAARDARARRRLLIGLSAVLVANVVMVSWVGSAGDSLDAFGFAAAEQLMNGLPTFSESLLRAGIHAGAFAALAIATLLLRKERRGLLMLVAVFDLIAAAPVLVAPHPPLADLHGPLVLLRPADRTPPEDVPVVCVSARLEELSIVHEGDDANFVDLRSARFAGVPEMQACDGVASVGAYSAPLQQRTVAELQIGVNQRSARAALALGCTHVLDKELPQGGGVELVPSFAPGGRYFDPTPGAPKLARLIDPIPPIFVAPAPIWTDEERLLKLVPRITTTAGMLRLVDDPLRPADVPLPSEALPDGVAAGDFRYEWRVRDEITVEVSGQGGAVVGARTAYWTGWRAEQAGVPLRTVRVAGVHLAAVVPDVAKGPIHFRYRPPGWPGALWLLALGALLTAIAALLLRRR